MLKVCGDGRTAALDLRLLGLPMTDPGKIETAAERITDLWHAHCDDTYPGPDGRESPTAGAFSWSSETSAPPVRTGTSTTNCAINSLPAACHAS